MDEKANKPAGECYRKAILDAFDGYESEVVTEERPVIPLSGSVNTESNDDVEAEVING